MAVDPLLEEDVRDDLVYLASDLTHTVSDAALKRSSVTLRKLLIDGGGTLRRYRRQLGLRGEPRIYATDVNALIGDNPRKAVDFAFAGGGNINGAFVAHAIAFRNSDMPGGPPKPSIEPLSRWFTLTDFMNATCLVLESNFVSRSDLIKYIANKMGGAHYDVRRKSDERAFAVLDQYRETYRVVDKSAVYCALLVSAQLLVESPDVAALVPEPLPRPHPHSLLDDGLKGTTLVYGHTELGQVELDHDSYWDSKGKKSPHVPVSQGGARQDET